MRPVRDRREIQRLARQLHATQVGLDRHEPFPDLRAAAKADVIAFLLDPGNAPFAGHDQLPARLLAFDTTEVVRHTAAGEHPHVRQLDIAGQMRADEPVTNDRRMPTRQQLHRTMMQKIVVGRLPIARTSPKGLPDQRPSRVCPRVSDRAFRGGPYTTE